ncbi:hypothetical protein [Promicromonospora sp. MEB111]|uniref:hypothetical protein n=1 Tax=unclassified Promicromonospora TaxID=2647929 RepID=UPI00254DD0C5|nr:hypothetical protein [Promicromonospora sp. MEB111]
MGAGWARRRRRLVARLSESGPVGGGLAALLSLGKARDPDCEELLTATALAVDGVVSARFECSDTFGGGWQRGKVVLRASSQDEAVGIMDALLRAFAAEPRLEPRWATPQEYRNEDGSVVVGARAVGFSGVPTIREVREHYGEGPAR